MKKSSVNPLVFLAIVFGLCLGAVLRSPKVQALMTAKVGSPVEAEGNERDEPADEAEQAYLWRRMAWLDHGKLDPTAYKRAVQQKAAMPKPPVSGDNWIEQGPTSIGGRTISMVVSPTNPEVLLVGAAGGGVWRSTNGGQNWYPVGDKLSSLAVGALAIDPNHPQTIYAGTGEAYFNGDGIGGDGIYKSTDGGTTWTILPGTSTWNDVAVETIAVDPTNSNNLLVAGWGGISRSTDGGNTFTNVFAAYTGDTIQFAPTDATKVVASYMDNSTGISSVVVSKDSGATWTKPTTPPTSYYTYDRCPAKFSPNSASVIFAATDTGNLFESTDGGVTFSDVTTSGSFDTGQFWYDFALWVDPTNPQRIVIGATYLYESTDGGQTINQIDNGYVQTNDPHPDVHFVTQSSGYNGTTNKTVYVCSDGGVFLTNDITTAGEGTGWTSLNFTARTAQYYYIAGDYAAGSLIGGTQDNASHFMSAGNPNANWWFGGDGGAVAMDPTNANTMYGEYVDLLIYRSTSGAGGNANYIYNGISDSGNGGTANFISPFMMDPNSNTTLLAGGDSLWRTTNSTATNPNWTAIRSPGSNLISTIAVAPQNSNIIWVGQNDGGIAHTSNGMSSSPTWTTLGGQFPLQRTCTKLLVDPSNTNLVYATFGGFSSNNVMETTDGGTTWLSISGTGSGTLPQVPVRTIARNPGNANILYIGTDIGIFSTNNGGSTWSAVSDGPANAAVFDLEYLNNGGGTPTLVAGTHGRGMWMLQNGLAITSLSVSPTSVAAGSSSTGTVTLNQPANAFTQVYLQPSDNNAGVPTEVSFTPGSKTATFTITTASGTVNDTEVITATAGSSSQTASLAIGGTSTATLQSVSLNPTSVTGGSGSTGTVTLTAPAPSGGSTVTLATQSSYYVPVPATVTVPAGSTSATFSISTKPYTSTFTNLIKATLNSVSKTATLTVIGDSVSALTLNPTSVIGGNSTTGTVTLSAAAPSGGWAVSLLSQSTYYVGVPSSVTVPAGSTSVTFTATTKLYTSTYTNVIQASDADSHQRATLTVIGDSISALSVSPTSLVGGAGSTGTVTLSAPAPTGGWVVNLLDNVSGYVTVPSTITVAAGSTTGTFAITTKPYSATFACVIQASDPVSKQRATLTVLGDSIASVTFSPSTVTGGATSTGTVKLTSAAPAGGWTVTLTSQRPTYVSVPATITIPAGATSGTFTATTSAFTSTYSCYVLAQDNNSHGEGTLTVNP